MQHSCRAIPRHPSGVQRVHPNFRGLRHSRRKSRGPSWVNGSDDLRVDSEYGPQQSSDWLISYSIWTWKRSIQCVSSNLKAYTLFATSIEVQAVGGYRSSTRCLLPQGRRRSFVRVVNSLLAPALQTRIKTVAEVTAVPLTTDGSLFLKTFRHGLCRSARLRRNRFSLRKEKEIRYRRRHCLSEKI